MMLSMYKKKWSANVWFKFKLQTYSLMKNHCSVEPGKNNQLVDFHPPWKSFIRPTHPLLMIGRCS